MKWPLEVGIAEFRTQAEKKHFPFKQGNQHPCTARPAKRVELPQNKQIIQLGFRKFREDQTSLSLLKLFENISAYISLSSSLRGGLLCIDLRRAFQLQVTHEVSSEKEAWKIPPPEWGREGALRLEFISKPPFCPWGQDSSKTGERNSTERRWERFLIVWTCLGGECLFLWDETRRQQSVCGALGEGFHSEGACDLLLGPGGRIWFTGNVQANYLPDWRRKYASPLLTTVLVYEPVTFQFLVSFTLTAMFWFMFWIPIWGIRKLRLGD